MSYARRLPLAVVLVVLATIPLWITLTFAAGPGPTAQFSWPFLSASYAVLLAAVVGGIVLVGDGSQGFWGRALLLAALIVASGCWLHDAILQWILTLGLVAGLLIAYKGFLGKLAIYAMSHPTQAVVLLLYLCFLYGWFGVSYGVPSLFWYESFPGRLLSAIGSVLLLATLGANAYFLDDNYWRNQDSFVDFLQGWGGYALGGAPSPQLVAAIGNRRNTPGLSVQLVSQFLRVARFPFLTLVALPALFPLVFLGVPRLAPVRKVWLVAGLLAEHRDAGHDGLAWITGVFCWGLGILLGVFLVKGLIRFSAWIERRLIALGGMLRGGYNRLAQLPPWLWHVAVATVSILIVVLAVVLTSMINLGYSVDPPWGISLQGPTYTVVGAALIMAVAWSGYRAYELRPDRWPAFARYLTVSVVAYVLVAIYDTGIRSWPGWENWDYLVSPGLAVSALLIVISLFGAWLRQLRAPSNQPDWYHWYRSDLIALGLVAVWIGVMNGDDYKMRFPGMKYQPEDRVDWATQIKALVRQGNAPVENVPSPGVRAAAGLLNDVDVLENWRYHVWQQTRRAQGASPVGGPDESFRPKLAVVCATGGASRAAYWTARVLDRLGRDVTGFRDGVRLITGASGGMVGAAYYLERRDRLCNDPGVAKIDWVRGMPTDSLSAVASHISFVSIAQALVPRLPSPWDLDRGEVLERQWTDLQRRFSDYRKNEAEGKIPSVVFSPVTVDDGRRLLISNLNLEGLSINRGGEIDAIQSGLSVYSVAAPEFYRFFGPKGSDLKLATAARMSATFPLVSPAVNLPTEPPIRVVDAGYYDNYGVNLAVAWIFRNRDWLVDRTSGVVLVQIRAFRGRQERLGPPPPGGDSPWNGIQFFSTPLEAFNGARDSTPMFRNDKEVAALGEVFVRLVRKTGRLDFSFTTVIFELSSQVRLETEDEDVWPFVDADRKARTAPPVNDVAMTWYLSEPEKDSMDRAIPPLEAAKKWKRQDNRPVPTKNEKERLEESLEAKPDDRLRLIEDTLPRFRAAQGAQRSSSLDEAQRAYYAKELERALNYERLKALKSWWEGQ